jgi:putative membrane protein
MDWLLAWLINAVSLLILPYVIPSIKIRGFGTALVVALVLGLINVLLRPILVLLTLPVTLITLGLFILVINALLFQFAAWLLKGFEVSGFWSAFFGSLLYSVISWLLSALVLGHGLSWGVGKGDSGFV